MAGTKLYILKMKAEADNCRRVAETAEGSMKEALLKRAGELDTEIQVLRAALAAGVR